MTDADLLAWHIEWRRKIRSAMRLWFNSTGYKDGCDRLTDLKRVLNETPPAPGAGTPGAASTTQITLEE